MLIVGWEISHPALIIRHGSTSHRVAAGEIVEEEAQNPCLNDRVEGNNVGAVSGLSPAGDRGSEERRGRRR